MEHINYKNRALLRTSLSFVRRIKVPISKKETGRARHLHCDYHGMALILAMVFMAMLMILGSMMVTSTVTGLKISGGVKRYEEGFSLADGACEISIKYLKKHNPSSPNIDPRDGVKITDGLPSYIKETTLSGGKKYAPQIWWKGYDTKPLPGWMLNWQGYSSYHRIHYKARGEGKPSGAENSVAVSAILVKITK